MTEAVIDTRARERFPLAWWGVAMLVATEGALFALLIASYFYLRFKNHPWPPRGIPEPKLVVPLVMLGVLVLTALPMWRAVVSATPRRWLLLALLVQAGYFAMEVHLYTDDLHHFTPQQHAYGSLYYTLLGASHGHVAVGLLFDLWLLLRPKAVRAIALYWYAVIALTVAVTLTVLSPAFAR